MASPSHSPLAAGCVATWRALLSGQEAKARVDAAALLPGALAARDGRRVVALTVAEALASCALGDSADAAALARRAFIRAQADARPFPERLAALALARVRRRAGRPHFAMHILTALAKVPGDRLRGWLAWELLLAGGADSARTVVHAAGDAREVRAAQAAGALVAAAQAADRQVFDRAAASLEAAHVIPDAAREGEALIACLDPTRSCDAPAVVAWRLGEVDEAPCGIHGIGLDPDVEMSAEAAAAFVIARPAGVGARVLGPGTALAGVRPLAELRPQDGDDDPESGGGARTSMGMAALALAGPAGLSRERFFRRVYGFAYGGERHRHVLKTLVHRMRSRLGDLGRIDQQGDSAGLVLTVAVPLAIPDPRCLMPAADRVLWAIARMDSPSAQQAANVLRMPLRTVQATLRQLVQEGACQVERKGSLVRYVIRETTFTSLVVVK